MYKVMLVDDEKLILQGVHSIIEWDKLGMEVIHLANNGEEALEKFKKEQVDIVITDINMPKLTGLELVKEIKNINNDVKFIILSGYDDFSYARTAIGLGVENYILKPIDEEELEASLVDISEKLDSEKNKHSDILAKNRALVKLINGDISNKFIESIKELINLDVNSNRYSVSLIKIRNNSDINYTYILNNTLKEITKESYEIIYNSDGYITLINSWNNNITLDDVIEYCKGIRVRLLEHIKADIFVSVGDIVNDIYHLNDSYKITNKLKKYVLTKGFNILVSSKDIENTKEENLSFTDEIDNLKKVIIEKNMITADYLVNKFLNREELTPKNIYDLSIKILILIDEISKDFNIGTKYRGDSLGDAIAELCSENTRDSIKSFLINEINEVMQSMNPKVIRYSPVVQQIIKYVNEKYYEDISLKTLGCQYNINTSYLGQLFTKEVGCSFSDYLNKTKNSKAKDLILNTNMKINDIAKRVGYQDTSYFYRKFKKYYGVCPSTLREIKNY